VGGADRAQDFGLCEEFAYGVEELVGEFLAALGQEVCKMVAIEVLPEAFDWVEIGAVGRQELRIDVVRAGVGVNTARKSLARRRGTGRNPGGGSSGPA
jgi:hypothetical protein